MILKYIRRKSFIDVLFVIVIFFLDIISKLIVISYDKNSFSNDMFSSKFLNIYLIWNEGIAFGLFSFNDKFNYNILTFLICVITTVVLYFFLKTKGIEKYSFLMIFSGSLGNIFDRLFYSAVPDFIDIHYQNFHWFIFNVADIFITLGVIILIINEIFLKKN